MKLQSLRSRLILIILAPLLLISVAAAAWQFRNATERAEEIFDRGLLSAALAISRDVAISDGDALSPATRALVSDTSGGELFYHVYAPDGVFVTGYATPPVRPKGASTDLTEPVYYNARYLGRDVRVLRFQDATTVSGLSGLFNITVWQNAEVRRAFVRDVVTRSFGVIALLVASVALVVWFGVGIGLRPLLDLEDAIALRSPSELTPIRRPVPVEARSLVTTLNALLDRVSRRISSKDEFISNAAHQLRNPIAGVLALAEAVQTAPTSETAKTRSAELVHAARAASHLTNQLLSFERARGSDMAQNGSRAGFDRLVRDVIDRFKKQVRETNTDIRLTYVSVKAPVQIQCDQIMLQEALINILTNCIAHGGPELTKIEVEMSVMSFEATLTISDDGAGIDENHRVLATGRFSQANAGPGSGLGLPIAIQVVESHGGSLVIADSNSGARIVVTLPLEKPPKAGS